MSHRAIIYERSRYFNELETYLLVSNKSNPLSNHINFHRELLCLKEDAMDISLHDDAERLFCWSNNTFGCKTIQGFDVRFIFDNTSMHYTPIITLLAEDKSSLTIAFYRFVSLDTIITSRDIIDFFCDFVTRHGNNVDHHLFRHYLAKKKHARRRGKYIKLNPTLINLK
jgi:hypothetical protein